MFNFRLLASTLLALVLICDAVVVARWQLIRDFLGEAFGLELALAVFFNFLGALLVVELVHESGVRPGVLEWYRRLPPGGPKSPVGRATIQRRLGMLLAMTVFFYSIDLFLLPVLPVTLKLPVDLVAVLCALALAVRLPGRSLVRGVSERPGSS